MSKKIACTYSTPHHHTGYHLTSVTEDDLRPQSPAANTLLLPSDGQFLLPHLSADILFSEAFTTMLRSRAAGIPINTPAVVFSVFMAPLLKHLGGIVFTSHRVQAIYWLFDHLTRPQGDRHPYLILAASGELPWPSRRKRVNPCKLLWRFQTGGDSRNIVDPCLKIRGSRTHSNNRSY